MKGKVFKPEARSYIDKFSGCNVVQLTNYFGHTCHMYFTNNSFYKGDLIIKSHRDNCGNYFKLKMDTKEIIQLTDVGKINLDGRRGDINQSAYVHEGNGELYYTFANKLYALDLETLKDRLVYAAPEGYNLGFGSPSSDGRYLMASLSNEIPETEFGMGFYDIWAAFPRHKIIRIETFTGKAEIIHEDKCWITHLNTSTTMPEIMTFCHEGPWDKVDHRIWLLNIITGEVSKIVPDCGSNKTAGHEYWFADGIHIGYHGVRKKADGSREGYYGCIKYDNTDSMEFSFPFHSNHFHSNDFNLIVGDGNSETAPYIMLWRFDGNKFDKSRVLALHRGSQYFQIVHNHPLITPDGKYVIYTSDTSSYANIYMVEIGDVADLPYLEDITPVRRQRW